MSGWIAKLRRSPLALDVAIGALVFAALALAYLAKPIALFGTHTYGTVAAACQPWSVTRAPDQPIATHAVLKDPPVQFFPWAMFNRAEFAAGRWPLWNPCNGAGVPHLANYQSAVLSPFTLPFYVLSLQAALIVAAFAKLLIAGWFGFLFLRQVGRSRPAALLGAIIATYSGFQLLWAQYPHTGVFTLLPAALFFAERVVASSETKLRVGSLAGWIGALALMALCGHPETLFYCSLLALAYCVARAIGATRAARSDRTLRRRVTARAGVLAIGAALSIGIAAVQLVPFVEYLRGCAALTAQRSSALALDLKHWPLLAFPNLFGTPSDRSGLAYDLPPPNYQEFDSFHVGALALLFVLASVAWLRRDGRARFFACVAAVWLVYASDAFGIAGWLAAHTPLGHVLVLRTQPIWIWPAAALAAFAVDQIALPRERRALAIAAAFAAAALVLLVVARWSAFEHLRRVAADRELALDSRLDAIRSHVDFTSFVFAVGALSVAALAVVRVRAVRGIAWCLALAATFVSSAAPFRDYITCTPNALCYPRNAALGELLDRVGDERVLVLSNDTVLADVNLVYGLHLVTSYDAMEIADAARLIQRLFGSGLKSYVATGRALDLFGVRYVLSRSRWLPIDTPVSAMVLPAVGTTPYLAPELDTQREPPAFDGLEADQPAILRFRAQRDGLTALSLLFLHEAESVSRRAQITLRDDQGATVVERTFALGELKRLVGERRELVLEFEPQAQSQQRTYELAVSALAGDGAGPRLLKGRAGKGYLPLSGKKQREDGDAGGDDDLTIGGRHVRGGLALDLAFAPRAFRYVGPIGDQELFVNEHSRGAVWLVDRAEHATTHEEAWELVLRDEFDPLSSVVIEGQSSDMTSELSGRSGELEIEARTPTSWRVRTRSDGAAWLVLAQPFFPGWRATIDELERPLRRANYALTALELPAGEHIVEISYEPWSFRLGAWLSIACTVAALAWLGVLARLARS